MPLESVEHAVGFLKTLCEEYGDEFPLDKASLYRHVRALLTDEEIPNALPADIVERCASGFVDLEMGFGKDREEAEVMTGPVATPEQWRAAAEWAFLLYRDYFGGIRQPATRTAISRSPAQSRSSYTPRFSLAVFSGKLPRPDAS